MITNFKLKVLCIRFSVFYGVLQITIAHNDVQQNQNVNVGLPNIYMPKQSDSHTATGGSESAESDDKFCNMVPTDVVLSRSTEKQGFHRDLATHINITFGHSIECRICWVLLAEVIPQGMYVNLHEVKSAEPFGGAKVLAFEDIDVEKPAYLSPEHTILVYVPHPLRVTESQHHAVQVKLPIHMRYHRPSVDPEVTSALVQLQHPYVMIRCQGSKSGCDLETFDLYQAPCDSSNASMCAWQDLKYHTINDKPLRFQVPVGQQSHTTFVTFLTIATAVAGMIALLWVIFSPEKNKIT